MTRQGLFSPRLAKPFPKAKVPVRAAGRQGTEPLWGLGFPIPANDKPKRWNHFQESASYAAASDAPDRP